MTRTALALVKASLEPWVHGHGEADALKQEAAGLDSEVARLRYMDEIARAEVKRLREERDEARAHVTSLTQVCAGHAKTCDDMRVERDAANALADLRLTHVQRLEAAVSKPRRKK